MYKHHIQEMVKALVDAKSVPFAEHIALDVLQKYWSDKMAIVWEVSDIIDYASSKDIKLTQEQAIEVLEKLNHKHDATIGINWDVIEVYLSDYD